MNTNVASGGRVEWIDTAKGICISLVVLHHVFACYSMYGQSGFLHHIYYTLQSFRIPLYYILSGLFFKSYGSITNLFIKKTNKILIPCVFFYITLSVLFPLFLEKIGDDIYGFSQKPFTDIITAIIFKEGQYPNGPIWFLFCLFQVNIIFCVLETVTRSIKQIIVLSVLIGCLGLFLSVNSINLYCNTDSAFTGVPFFCFGYYLRKHTAFISNTKPKTFRLILFIILSFVFVFLFSRNAEFNFNKFANVYTVYPCGIIGSLLILTFSKYVRRIVFVSYWGRYSLIILSTHYVLIDLVFNCFPHDINKWYVCFMLIMFAYYVIIPLFVRFLPYVTAQKDILKLRR